MFFVKSFGLFIITAGAELLGSYLMYLWLRQGKPAWYFLPALASFILFGWLLTLHPGAAARTYAAYGGVYVFSALLWLRFIEGQNLTRWDVLGVLVILLGAGIIIYGKA
ncbi:MAG: YnfA family protein [Chloroflexi bacterium]|nr:MAG: YnfA family protein [Chloroflexota bacterium]